MGTQEKIAGLGKNTTMEPAEGAMRYFQFRKQTSAVSKTESDARTGPSSGSNPKSQPFFLTDF